MAEAKVHQGTDGKTVQLMYGEELVHEFKVGGEGHGYCLMHGDFDCIKNLNDEDKEVVENAS